MLVLIGATPEGRKKLIGFQASVRERCCVHFMQNAPVHVLKAQHQMVTSAIRIVLMQADHAIASAVWCQVADQLRARLMKLAALMDEGEADVIAFMAYLKSHWARLHSINPIERLNKEVKRRVDVVGIFLNETLIRRLVGAACWSRTTIGSSSTIT